MKRIIAMFVVLCIFFSSNICYVQASEYEFVAISIIDGINSNKQEGKKYSVIRVDNDLMFSGEDLAEITGFEYEIKGQQVTFKRDYKEVKINLKNNKYTALKHLGNQSFENEVIYVNGKYYYPGAEILPWLNVLCFAKEDMLCIKRDEISYWDFGENFKGEMKGLQFDFVACCNELNVNSKWLKITSYVKDRGLGGTFQDILWIPGTASTVGGTLEYMDILEEMLADGDRVESACSELKKDMEVYQAGIDIVDLIDEIDDLPEDLQVAKKVSDVVPGLSMGVDMVMYTRLLKLDTTERLMWVETICRNRDYYDYPDALVGAALSISNIYDEEECFDDYFEKFMNSAMDVTTGEFIDALTGKGIVKGMLSMFGLYSAVCPEWNEGINRIGKYNAIAKCSMEAYQEKIISTSIDGIESQRANAMLFLYATEHNWQVMADYAKDKGKSSYAKKYEKMAKEALRWQGKFLASSSSTVNDSDEYKKKTKLKSAYVGEIRKMFNDVLEYKVKENDLKEKLLNNYWYEFQPLLGEYYLYTFNEDGTYSIRTFITTVDEEVLPGNRSYYLEGDTLSLIDAWTEKVDYMYDEDKNIFYYEVPHYETDDDAPYYGGMRTKLIPSKELIDDYDAISEYVYMYNKRICSGR